jgi:hypothetical protein
LAPPPSPPRAHAPGRHDERGAETSTWPPAGTYTWPSTRTFPWPWTAPAWSRPPSTSAMRPRRPGLLRDGRGRGIPSTSRCGYHTPAWKQSCRSTATGRVEAAPGRRAVGLRHCGRDGAGRPGSGRASTARNQVWIQDAPEERGWVGAVTLVFRSFVDQVPAAAQAARSRSGARQRLLVLGVLRTQQPHSPSSGALFSVTTLLLQDHIE